MTHALILALALTAPGEVSIERGKTLFSNQDLGANGKTCALCHAGGKNLDPDELRGATAKDVAVLSNHCLSLRMKSEKLPLDSPELRSLVLYVRALVPRGR